MRQKVLPALALEEEVMPMAGDDTPVVDLPDLVASWPSARDRANKVLAGKSSAQELAEGPLAAHAANHRCECYSAFLLLLLCLAVPVIN